MVINPLEVDQQNIYKVLAGSVVPRPIAWVSTVDADGMRNLAPFSFFNVIGSNPPAVTVSIMHSGERPDNRKDTLSNIVTTGQFVVNLVDEVLVEAMNITAANFPAHTDEFAAAKLEAAPSLRVKPPRVSDAPLSFECELHTTVPVGEGPGSATLVIGRIVLMHIRDDVIDERYRIDLRKLRPVGRLAGNDYAYVHETFVLVRPRYNSETGQIEPS